jgi:hypothetical protein
MKILLCSNDFILQEIWTESEIITYSIVQIQCIRSLNHFIMLSTEFSITNITISTKSTDSPQYFEHDYSRYDNTDNSTTQISSTHISPRSTNAAVSSESWSSSSRSSNEATNINYR